MIHDNDLSIFEIKEKPQSNPLINQHEVGQNIGLPALLPPTTYIESFLT